METKHTKGEWVQVNKSQIFNENHHGILAFTGFNYDSDQVEVRDEGESWLSMRKRTEEVRVKAEEEQLANAKLIAAAPDLLEACMAIKDYFTDPNLVNDLQINDELDIVQEAIKKATE